jgi:hypothetical protein
VRLLFDWKQVWLCNLLRIKRKLVAGGRDRTADLGVMNHHLGKNLSLCLLYGCSHQEFSPDFYPFPFVPVPYRLVLSILDTIWPQERSRHWFDDQIEIHTPTSSAELRIANQTTGKNVSYCLFESCSHRRKIEVFTFLPRSRAYASSYVTDALTIIASSINGDS